MNGEQSERRLVENEVIVREMNQKVVVGLTELKELAVAHGQASLAPDVTEPLHFYCECSNIDCTKRVLISPADYEKIHKNSRCFIIVKHHESPTVERVVKNTPEYDIVEKNLEPAQILG